MTRSALRNDGGAVMLFGLAMALVLAGLMYSLIAIGEAIMQREGMQDAADAAALSGAILHARGMNTLVLINLIMAALLAVLVALKLAEALVGVAIVVLLSLSLLQPGLAALARGLSPVRQSIRKSHEVARRQIHPALETLHDVARGVRVVVPWAAQARVAHLVRTHHAPPAQTGFLWPVSASLPTEDGSFSLLCDRAGDMVGDLAALPFDGLNLLSAAGAIDGAIEDLAGAGAGWFCGSGEARAPSTTVEYEQSLPVLAARALCTDYGPDDPGFDEATHGARCAQAERDEEAAQPSRRGECRTRCEPGGPYDQRVTLAREACDPERTEGLGGYRWQQRTVERTWRFVRGAWQLERENATEPVLVERPPGDRSHPCGRGGSVSEAWVREAWTDDEPRQARPLCTSHRLPRGGGSEGDTRVHEGTEVLQLFGCSQRTTRRVEVSEAADDPARGASEGQRRRMVPQILADGFALGSEPLQLRGIVIGQLPRRSPLQAVEAAGRRPTGGAHEPAVPRKLLDAAARFGRLSLAQAEYFYAVTDPAHPDPASWMWNMRWQARLRRLRPPAERPPAQADPDPAEVGAEPPARNAGAACRRAGGEACALADEVGGGLLEEMGEWIVH